MPTNVKSKTDLQHLQKILEEQGILRTGDLKSLGFPPSYLAELHKRGLAIREMRGIYRAINVDVPAHYSLSLANKKAPNGVICLLSALAFHQIGTQAPHDIWIAIDRKARLPQSDSINLKTVRFSGDALTEGIVEIPPPFPMRVYNPAKTIADCFKYRNKFGLDVALEALQDGWRNRRFTIEEINHYARICRVQNVMTPYLEAIL